MKWRTIFFIGVYISEISSKAVLNTNVFSELRTSDKKEVERIGNNVGDLHYNENTSEDTIHKDYINNNHIPKENEAIFTNSVVNSKVFAKDIRQSQATLMKLYMDTSADPCEDFYQYACGQWDKINPIPEDRSDYSMFSVLQESLHKSLRQLLSEKPSGEIDSNGEPSAEDKAKNLFKSCMNDEMKENVGYKPLVDFLELYGGWPALNENWRQENFDWQNVTAHLSRLYANNLLRTSVEVDLKNSSWNTIYIDEPTLTLPLRENYMIESHSLYIDAYHDLVVEVLDIFGVDKELANQSAEEIISFETELARLKADPKDRLEVLDLYYRITISELQEDYTGIDWQKFLSIIFNEEISTSENVVILSKDYIRQLPVLISKTEPRILANYILWRYVKGLIEDLDERFTKIDDKFNQVFTGQETALPKWKKCVKLTNAELGFAVGAMYVRTHFDETSKVDVVKLTREIQQSFRDALTENDWLDAETKKLSEEKVNVTTLEVGYPNFILSQSKLNEKYKGISIHPQKYFENSLQLAAYNSKREFEKRNKLVDKSNWPGHPATVNAYFEQTKNRIIIPAGILQPPVYNQHLPQALNYGGIGAFIGHELTHGFDDTGRNFNTNGDMEQWWTNNSIEAFGEKVECFTKQFDNFKMHGKSLDGNMVKAENIADSGGIRQAYSSYKRWLDRNKDSNIIQFETLPGLNLNNKQLFFLGFAQLWCSAIRPEGIDNRIGIDVHSPGKFRVLGTLTNFEEFATEFNCPSKSGMNPVEKCKVW